MTRTAASASSTMAPRATFLTEEEVVRSGAWTTPAPSPCCVDDALYIDAENSTHWSKRMNHNALAPNVDFDLAGVAVSGCASRRSAT